MKTTTNTKRSEKAREFLNAGFTSMAAKKRANELVSREYDAVRSELMKDFLVKREAEPTKADYYDDLYWDFPDYVHNFKVENLNLNEDYNEAVERILKLKALRNEIKDAVVTKPLSKKAKADIERVELELSVSDTGRARVEKLVTDISEVWRKRIEADYRKRVFGAIREFRIAEDILVIPYTKSYSPKWNRNNHYYSLFARLVDSVHMGMYSNKIASPKVYTLKPEWKTLLKAAVKRDGEEAVARFIYKVTGKLLSIVDNIPGDFEVTTHGELWRSTLLFKWTSGVSFIVENKIVYAVRGWTPYNSFPLTFHKVILEDGSRMKTPSEAKLKKYFGRVLKIVTCIHCKKELPFGASYSAGIDGKEFACENCFLSPEHYVPWPEELISKE